MNCGAPDLPFFQTVLWYLKQFAAVATILVVIGTVLLAGSLIRDRKR